jgi:hypothetical protein
MFVTPKQVLSDSGSRSSRPGPAPFTPDDACRRRVSEPQQSSFYDSLEPEQHQDSDQG